MGGDQPRKRRSRLRVFVMLAITFVLLLVVGVVGVFAWIMLQPRPDYHAMLREKLADPWDDKTGSHAAYNQLIAIGERYRELDSIVFPHGIIENDGFSDLWHDVLDQSPMTPQMRQRIEGAAAIVEQERLGERLAAALDERPLAPLPPGTTQQIVGSRVADYRSIRTIARAETALARFDWLEGRYGEAVDRLERVARLADCISRQGLLIDFMIGQAITMLAVNKPAVWALESAPGQLASRRLVALLGEPWIVGVDRPYAVERYFTHAAYGEMPGIAGILARTRHQSLDQHYDALAEAIELHEADPVAASVEFARLADEGGWLKSMLQEQVLDPSRLLVSVDGIRMERDAARLLVAIELFHQLYGAYPNSLEDLVPGILDELPTHNFDGGTFLYRRYDEGEPRPPNMEGRDYALYVIGLDGEDNGGTPKTSYNNVYGDLRTVGDNTPDASLRGTDYVFNRSDRLDDPE